MPTLSIVIPAYNEEKRIVPFLASIGSYLKTHPDDIYEVLVVDDGSTDDTFMQSSAVGMYIPGLRVIQHKKNQGKGAAVRSGVLEAKGDFIVFMDADGATSIEELPKMIAALRTADVAVGNRWMKGAKTERHSILRALSGFTYRNYMALFGLGAIDTMCGFKGYKASVAKDLYTDLQEQRWLFDTEIAYKAVVRGYTIKNFPITWESKDGSKLDTRTLIRSALQILPLVQAIKRKEEQRKA
jgi:glycosyltransferase involved in cell wall biosynthesis